MTDANTQNNQSSTHHKIIKKKSPRCPTMPLSEALDRALRVYEKEARHEAPSDVIAQNMGYTNSRSGAAAQSLASLSYFGLLIRPAEGKLAVSKEVEEYKFAPQESLKQDILRKWLKTPAIYSELLDKYSTGLPSDATLKYDFIQKGFNAKVADAYVSAFRQSVELVKYYDTAFASSEASQTNVPFPEAPIKNSAVNVTPGAQPNRSSINANSASLDMEGHDSIPIRLPGGRKAILIIPSPFYEADKARLKSQIDNIYADEEEQDDFSDIV